MKMYSDIPTFKARPVEGVRPDEKDGIYFFESLTNTSLVQIVVVGPMHYGPGAIAKAYGNWAGKEYRVSEVLTLGLDTLGLDTLEPTRAQVCRNRGFIDIRLERIG